MKNDKKKVRLIVLVSCLLAAAAVTSVALFGAAAGSAENPLVSYEYITGAYRDELYAYLYDKLSEEFGAGAGSDRAGLVGDVTLADNGDITAANGEVFSDSYVVVHIGQGDALFSAGKCEIILRSGKASVCVTSQVNVANGIGLSDLTAGAEITHGTAVPTNHQLLVPRADGRGIVVTSDEAYIMVRGDFEIVEG